MAQLHLILRLGGTTYGRGECVVLAKAELRLSAKFRAFGRRSENRAARSCGNVALLAGQRAHSSALIQQARLALNAGHSAPQLPKTTDGPAPGSPAINAIINPSR